MIRMEVNGSSGGVLTPGQKACLESECRMLREIFWRITRLK